MPVTSSPEWDRTSLNKLVLEAAAAGLAYGAALCAVSVGLVGSFQPQSLRCPYWAAIPWLRSDTFGVVAFLAASSSFAMSEYLRARRGASPGQPADSARRSLALAVNKTVVLFGTGLFVYLSTNAVTHPGTLGLPATHLAGWPTEGTLRVLAVLFSACSRAVLRYLRAQRADQGPSGGVDGRPRGSSPPVS
jgi:hypothetical protein